MNRELQNMSEESLQNLEAIVETELLTVEDIREGENPTVHTELQVCVGA